MLRQLVPSLRTAGRWRAAPRFFSQSSSHAAPASGVRNAALRRGAAFALVTAAGAALLLQTRGMVHLDAFVPSPDPSAASDATRMDPDTGIAFPETLVVPSRVRLPPFSLVGLGVRTVSFLGIKVYSVGFYADLSNPSLKVPEDATPDEKIDYIISNTACALRLIPTRNTSYAHLRDGFLRTIQARMSAQLKRGVLSPADAEDAQSPLRKLKSMFPNTKLGKGETLDILLLHPPKGSTEKRVLVIRDLGSIESNWLAKEFVMAYFEGTGLSPPMKKSVVAFLQEPPTVSAQ
ncbi:chalcone-flavanone isomerase-domain-containing protein [Phellopilus nigrolimitatus]|nr:chalcone-flavanone isomerase-domain-containing protein [Phellopilus nigrolimitatus]